MAKKVKLKIGQQFEVLGQPLYRAGKSYLAPHACLEVIRRRNTWNPANTYDPFFRQYIFAIIDGGNDDSGYEGKACKKGKTLRWSEYTVNKHIQNKKLRLRD